MTKYILYIMAITMMSNTVYAASNSIDELLKNHAKQQAVKHTDKTTEPVEHTASLQKRSSATDIEIRNALIAPKQPLHPKLIARGLMMVNIKGEDVIITVDGKLMIRGGRVSTLMTARRVSNDELMHGVKIDWVKLGIDTSRLTGFTIGHGKRNIYVFVDPLCPNCHSFLRDAKDGTPDNITFHVVPVSVISRNKSEQVSNRLLTYSSDKMYGVMLSNTAATDYSDTKPTKNSIKQALYNLHAYSVTQSTYVPVFIDEHGSLHESYGGMSKIIAWLNE